MQYPSLVFSDLRCNASPAHGSYRGVASVRRDNDVRPHASIVSCVEGVEGLSGQTSTEARLIENSSQLMYMHAFND